MNTLEFFKKITGYDLDSLLSNFNSFQKTEINSILSYYNNSSSSVPNEAFKQLDLLKDEFNKVINLFEVNSSIFATNSYWDLFEIVEDALNSLNLVESSNKFLR